MRMPLLLLGLFISVQCSAQQPARVLQMDEHHVVILADSAMAAQYITTDTIDLFFERVTAVEMSIQMKTTMNAGTSREDMVRAYRSFLMQDVESFSAGEANMVEAVFRRIFPNCMKVNTSLFPDTLILIKTKAKHYGEGVYYTRANTIVIPQDALDMGESSGFRSTMYHEIFHVYSRLHPEKRDQLYKLIGFSSLGYNRLQLPDALAERVLHNPDGVDFAQKIDLKQADGAIIHAIPIIYANEPGFTKDKTAFFGYLEFELFQIEQLPDGSWKVLTQDDGVKSTLDLRRQPDFFKQIRDNTGYIIHPDEVLADNFTFVLEGLERGSPVRKFSESGSELLTEIESLLRQ
jgi:hypothetical protein